LKEKKNKSGEHGGEERGREGVVRGEKNCRGVVDVK